MADLTSNFVGITSPNPFWLASAPPTDKEYNVRRAFEAGWALRVPQLRDDTRAEATPQLPRLIIQIAGELYSMS